MCAERRASSGIFSPFDIYFFSPGLRRARCGLLSWEREAGEAERRAGWSSPFLPACPPAAAGRDAPRSREGRDGQWGQGAVLRYDAESVGWGGILALSEGPISPFSANSCCSATCAPGLQTPLAVSCFWHFFFQSSGCCGFVVCCVERAF